MQLFKETRSTDGWEAAELSQFKFLAWRYWSKGERIEKTMNEGWKAKAREKGDLYVK